MIRYLHIRDANRTPYATIAYQFTDDGKLIFGASRKSPLDKEFSKEFGRNLATKRLLTARENTAIRCTCETKEFISFDFMGSISIQDIESPYFSFIYVPTRKDNERVALVVVLNERT